jgi:hypothetical protein
LNSLKKSVEARKTRLANLMVDFDTTDFLDIYPLTLDGTQMTRSKSVLVLNTSIEMVSQYCFLRAGHLPMPSIASDFDLFKTLLTKSGVSAQVINLRLESSFLVHDSTGALFDAHPSFIAGLELGTTTASPNAKSLETFLKDDA